MREDYMENLDKMFPAGYLIIYTVGNELRLNLYNPNRDATITYWHERIKESTP